MGQDKQAETAGRIQGQEDDQSQELEERCGQEMHSFLKKNIYLSIYLAVSGLSCGTRGLHFAEGFSPVRAQRLQNPGLSSCGACAQLLCGMWDLSSPDQG